MPTIVELKSTQCHYPLDERGQFCGVRCKRKEPHERERSSYCLYHHGICHSGFGKDWSALVEMVNAKESTVLTTWQESEIEAAVDEAICSCQKPDKQSSTLRSGFWRRVHGHKEIDP